jgi:hypothetical protein
MKHFIVLLISLILFSSINVSAEINEKVKTEFSVKSDLPDKAVTVDINIENIVSKAFLHRSYIINAREAITDVSNKKNTLLTTNKDVRITNINIDRKKRLCSNKGKSLIISNSFNNKTKTKSLKRNWYNKRE